ncbi:MAG: M20 family peptidase [Pseudomonadales bacterium]
MFKLKRNRIVSGLAIGLVFVLILAIALIVRTLNFSPVLTAVSEVPKQHIPAEAITRLSQAVQIQTISALSDDNLRQQRFQQFHDFLTRSFPRVSAELSLIPVNGDALLYRWQGSNASLKPILLLSHQDVVPVEPGTEQDWQYPPFAGAVADGFVWGRGAWDDKSTLMASLEALEMLLKEGEKPTRTLMLAFGHDEEVGGEQGAAAIAEQFRKQGLEFEFILDEGAVIGMGLVPGVSQPVAMIATAEKGYLTLRLTTEGQGGHSSVPPAVTAVGRLAKAVGRLQDEPLPAKLTEPVRDMFEALGPHMPWSKRLVLSNLWLFEPLLVSQMAGSRSTQAHVRTTTAPTMLTAGVKENVLPQTASAIVNFRILPGQSSQQVIQQVQDIIADDLVQIEDAGSISSEPSPISNRNSAAFDALSLAIRQVNPDVLVSPALLFGATDSRHFGGLSANVFRFTPIRISGKDFSRLHGTNERIAVADYENAIRFYFQLITNTVVNPVSSNDG